MMHRKSGTWEEKAEMSDSSKSEGLNKKFGMNIVLMWFSSKCHLCSHEQVYILIIDITKIVL